MKNEANFTLTFTISGTNTASYNTIDEKEFIVMPTEITVAGNVTKCTNTAPTRTKTSLFATPDTDGIIMYYLVAERAVDLTAE